MYAIIESGGKQYKVSEGDVIQVERLEAEPGQTVEIDRVLAVGRDDGLVAGTPYVPGARVTAQVVSADRAAKIVVLKKKRRKGYRRKQGHRQERTGLRIVAIAS